MPDIKEIRSAAAERSNIMVTAHAAEQMKIRGIKIPDIYSALDNGEIIEDYPSDYPVPMKWEPDFRTRRREAS